MLKNGGDVLLDLLLGEDFVGKTAAAATENGRRTLFFAGRASSDDGKVVGGE